MADTRRRRPRRLPRTPPSADAFLHQHTATELLERLDVLALQPQHITEVGTHTGALLRGASDRYPNAATLTVPTLRSLPVPRRRWPWQRQQPVAAGTLNALPLAAASTDLVLCNLALARLPEPDTALVELARILRPGGALTLATLGPDSLTELRTAWRHADPAGTHVMPFVDMHDLGEALLRHGFTEPVLDVERLTLSYRNLEALWRDLDQAAARGVLPASDTPRGMTTPARWQRFETALGQERPLTLTVELVYVQCWRGQQPIGQKRGSHANDVSARIRPDQIGRRV